MQDLERHIEAVIFSSDHPVSVSDLVSALNKALELELEATVVMNHLEALLVKYEEPFFPFKIVKTGGGYRFLTKEDYHPTVSTFLNIKAKRRLSTAAMETLAIVAYKQPISKTEVENIRGVNCDYSIQKLLERELIVISGRSESPGKPLLYSTSPVFMDYFGINSVDELPKLREFEEGGDSIGIPTESLEDEVLLGEEEVHAAAEKDAMESAELAEEVEAAVETEAYEDGDSEVDAESEPDADSDADAEEDFEMDSDPDQEPAEDDEEDLSS